MEKDISDEEKAKEACETFACFLDGLGPNDIYKRIFLEVLLEEIYGKRVDLSDVFKLDAEQKPGD